MPRDTYVDVAAILNPLPEPQEADRGIDDSFQEAAEAATAERLATVERLRLAWEEGEVDPVLDAVAAARRVRERAEEEIRQLLAYGREFVSPRPYTLAELAEAAGMSISGARTAYDHQDVEAVAHLTGGRPREWRAGSDRQPKPATKTKKAPAT